MAQPAIHGRDHCSGGADPIPPCRSYLRAETDSFTATSQQEFPAFTQYVTNNERVFPGISENDFPLVDAYHWGLQIQRGLLTIGVQIHSPARENFHRIELDQYNIGPSTGVLTLPQLFLSSAIFVPAGDYTIPSGFGGSEFGLSAGSLIYGSFSDEPGVDLIEMRCVYEHDSGTNQSIDKVWLTIVAA